ncbi:MAG: STAS/SEC14 domain-containing protein [Bacteroidetes bacterium]|nr:STAS/SEC14 domain-containing protein [Bacteroidota bacterium]
MKTFDTPNFTMDVHENCLVEFKIKKGVALSENDVWLSRDLSTNFLPGKKFFVLTEAQEEFKVTQGARHAGASKEYAQHVKAHALCTSNLTLKILSNLFIKVSRPVVPTRFFDEREKALDWLNSYR